MNRGDQDSFWDDEPGDRGLVSVSRPVVVRNPGGAVGRYEREEPLDDGPGFNFMQYWYMLVKHRRLVAGALAASLALGLVATLLTTPIYRATATVQIDRESSNVVDIEGVEPASSTGDREYYQTQYALLKSRSLAERVVNRLNLADDPAFTAPKSNSPVTFLKRLVNRSEATGAESTADRASREKRAAARLLSNLTVEPVRGSRLVQLSYESRDPRLAARVSNAIAENYIGANLDRRFESSSYARKFLEERLAQVKGKLEESERQLVAYAAAQQLITLQAPIASGSAEQTASTSLTASNLVAMNNALSEAKSARIMAEQRWRQAAGTSGSAPEILQSPAVQGLRATRAALQTQYQEKLSVYKPDFPAMVQLKAQIDEIDRQIGSEAQMVKQSLRAQYEVAVRQEQSLQGQVTGLTSGVLDQRSRSIQYNIIQREVDTNRTLYDGLLARYKEIGVAGGLAANNISIVERAEPPRRPYKPNLMLNLLVAAGVGLLIGIAAALALESLDDTIKMPEDIEGKLGIPLLGSIPILEPNVTPYEALADARSAFSEAYYSVRTALQFSTNEGVPSNLLITSARPSEGKSTTAVALARNFAKLGMKVLLVDGDLRNPSLHRIIGTENEVGLANFLTARGTMTELVQVTDEPNLAFMSCGPLPPNPAELLAGPKMRRLIAEAKQHFDLMIIDGPPIMGLADAPLLASVAGGTVIVIEAGSTKQRLIKGALRRLDVGGARILGALLTKFSVKAAGYGYGYEYAYSYDYGSKQIEAK